MEITNTLNSNNEILIKIPFSGFNQTIHGVAFDEQVDLLEEEAQNPTKDIAQNFTGYMNAYAKQYVQMVQDLLGIPISFDSVKSPAYYNFETDTILATITKTRIAHLASLIKIRDLSEYIKANFTSYDGFISNYSPNLNDWMKTSTQNWDQNMLGALIGCLHAEEIESLYCENAEEIACEYVSITD